MKKRYLKLISVLLVSVIAICALPVTAAASDTESTPIINEAGSTETSPSTDYETHTDTLDYDNPDISTPIIEIESRREENVKHFILPDGSIEAVIYGNAVHRKDSEGKWKDIDNNLSETYSKISSAYATKDQRVLFSKTISTEENVLTLNENGYGIAMSLIQEQLSAKATDIAVSPTLSTTKITNSDSRADIKTWSSIEEARSVNNNSSILYSNIKKNTDLEYILNGNNIKENIIVKDRCDSYIYTFKLELSGLTPTLNKDGSIILSDSDTGESKYNIPAPYMYDANSEYSYNVYYTLSENEEGVYTLKVIADNEWINAEGRAFPVTIDPSIEKKVVFDTYIDSTNSTANYSSSTALWISPTKIPFLKIAMPTDPTIPNDATITSAYFHVAYYYYSNVTSNTLTAGAYMITAPWSEGDVTWNTANAYSNLGISTTQLSTASFPGYVGAYASTPEWVEFDVTSAVSAWHNGTSNYGIAIKRISGTNSSVLLKSSNSGTTYRPYFTINYTEPRITNGVYKIKNKTTGKYIDVTDSGTSAGTQLQQWSGTTSDGNRAQLFKITFIQLSDTYNYYTIRPLTNCGQGINIPASGTATVEELQTADAWGGTSWDQSIAIIDKGDSYALKSGTVIAEQYLTAPSSGTNGTKLYTSSTLTDSGLWSFEKYSTAIDGVTWTRFDSDVIVGETASYSAVMYSSTIGNNGPITYLVKNSDGTATDKATINPTTGSLTAIKSGAIRICAKPAGGNTYWYRTITILPSFAQDLIDNNLTSFSNIRSADDMFYMLTTPLSTILNSAGITHISSNSVIDYYDDWYIYAVKVDNSYKYSMLKMRETEYEYPMKDGNTPGVTISFVELDYSKLIDVINDNTTSNQNTLMNSLKCVTGPGNYEHCPEIANYFSLTSSYAPYLIAEEYIKIIANTSTNGILTVSPEFVSIMNNSSNERLSNALLQNNSDAGYNIYNTTNHTITISNINNLTTYEKYAILITHTANVNFNSFAAEVEFHADAVSDWLTYLPLLGSEYHERALRADMAVGEEATESSIFDDYYDLNSDMVIAQANAHGEY